MTDKPTDTLSETAGEILGRMDSANVESPPFENLDLVATVARLQAVAVSAKEYVNGDHFDFYAMDLKLAVEKLQPGDLE